MNKTLRLNNLKIRTAMNVKISVFVISVETWKYNISKNVNSDFSIVIMRRVAIIFFELGVLKNLMQTF